MQLGPCYFAINGAHGRVTLGGAESAGPSDSARLLRVAVECVTVHNDQLFSTVVSSPNCWKKRLAFNHKYGHPYNSLFHQSVNSYRINWIYEK